VNSLSLGKQHRAVANERGEYEDHLSVETYTRRKSLKPTEEKSTRARKQTESHRNKQDRQNTWEKKPKSLALYFKCSILKTPLVKFTEKG